MATGAERRIVVRGGMVADGTAPFRADVAIVDGVISEVGRVAPEAGDRVHDAAGRYLLPGFIDAHSHADAAVFDENVQHALLRQGVTTVIVGQDGVSYAPGDGGYATEYFAALNGPHPRYTGGGVGALLAAYDNSTPLNVGYLVPAGTIRHAVVGYEAGPAGPEQLARMRTLVASGLEEGALGLSSGLDYVPGIHQDTLELAELCRPVAAVDGVHVTHLRGGYEDNTAVGTDELSRIAQLTGVRVHISHYHGPSDLLIGLLRDMQAASADVSFDAYPYRRGCSLLEMPVLPARLLSASRGEVLNTLSDPAVRRHLLGEWFPGLAANPTLGPDWPESLTFAHIASPEYADALGRTVADAAGRRGRDPGSFILDVLIAARLQVSVVMRVRNQRAYDELARLFRSPAHTAGSDGIYVGRHPHPRGWGTFAKYLRLFTRERGDWGWGEAAQHLSTRAAERFGLTDRGRLLPGSAADIAIVDPDRVADRADYRDPRALAVGIDDVLVAGIPVLAGGELTGRTPGMGLRRRGGTAARQPAPAAISTSPEQGET